MESSPPVEAILGAKRPRVDDDWRPSTSRTPDDVSTDVPTDFVDVDGVGTGPLPAAEDPAAGPSTSPPRGSRGGRLERLLPGGGEGPAPREHRRMKQPTLASFGLVSDTAVLRKALVDQQSHLETLREEVAALKAEIAHREQHLRLVEGEGMAVGEKLRQFQAAMRLEMRRVAKQGHAERRRALHDKHFELGHVTTLSSSGREMWVEGNVMRELRAQLHAARRRREEVEGLKKAAQNALKQVNRQEREREDSATGLDGLGALMEAQEELQLRTVEQAALTNTIAQVQQRMSEVENEKRAFLKEIRRLHDEDASELMGASTIGKEERYVLMYLLGKGGFSEVWRAFDMFEARYVACKVHRVNREWPAATRQHYLRHAERELEIMRQLEHPHLTTLYDVFPLGEAMFVSVMEFSHGMDLDTYLKRYGALKEADARLILLQIVSALRYLANLDHPIIHYDLKPANILLHSEDPGILEIKITDFGLSKIIHSNRGGPSDNPSIELTSQGTGTYWYLPPECFETSTTPLISNKVDVWSAGVIFYQMLYGRRPFAEGESQRKIWQEKLIISSARTLHFPDTVKVCDEAKDLMRQCLAFNAQERFDINKLSQHPYLFRSNVRSGKARGVAPPPATVAAAPVTVPSEAP